MTNPICKGILSAALALPATLASADGPAAKITLADGSVVLGEILEPAMKIKTLLGEVEIPFDKIAGVEFVDAKEKMAPQQPAPKAPENNDPRLIYWNTFDSKEDTQKPKVGPVTEFLTGKFVLGKNGNALHSRGKTDLASFTIPPGFVTSKGCVEFWAKIDVDTDAQPGQALRFLLGGRDGKWTLFKLEYTANNGMGAGGFTAAMPSAIYGTSWFGPYSFRQILGDDYTGWHHYAFVWDDDEGVEIPGERTRPHGALFIDGKFVSIQTVPVDRNGISGMGGFQKSGMDFIIAGSPHSGDKTTPFVIDDLKIWNVPYLEFVDKTKTPAQEKAEARIGW